MKKLLTVCLLAFAAAGATGCRSAAEGVKPKLMWLDCSANWVRFTPSAALRQPVAPAAAKASRHTVSSFFMKN